VVRRLFDDQCYRWREVAVVNTCVVDVPSWRTRLLLSWPRPLHLGLSLLLAIGLPACGGGGGGGGDGDDDGSVDGAADDDGADGADDGTDDGADGADDGTVVDSGPDFEQVPLIEGLTTLAGAGITGTYDGDRDTALFNNPVNVVMTVDGDLIVADFDNNLVRLVTPAGDVTTISEPTEDTLFLRPFGMVIAGDTLYVQTDGNSLGLPGPPGGALWRMPITGGAPELVRDNIGRCRGLAFLSDGRLVLSDRQGHVVSLFDPASGVVTPLAGTQDTPGFADGQGGAAQFNEPYDVMVLAGDIILVADYGNHRLRQIALDGTVTTYAGTGAAGSDDGALADATFYNPKGLAMDAAGTLYVTDTGSHLVRRISSDGQVTTIAGDGAGGWKDDADPRGGELFGIEGLDVSSDGYLYIADGTVGEALPYHRIRRLTLPSE
jgi:sugar lactone lactonase YvrE